MEKVFIDDEGQVDKGAQHHQAGIVQSQEHLLDDVPYGKQSRA